MKIISLRLLFRIKKACKNAILQIIELKKNGTNVLNQKTKPNQILKQLLLGDLGGIFLLLCNVYNRVLDYNSTIYIIIIDLIMYKSIKLEILQDYFKKRPI